MHEGWDDDGPIEWPPVLPRELMRKPPAPRPAKANAAWPGVGDRPRRSVKVYEVDHLRVTRLWQAYEIAAKQMREHQREMGKLEELIARTLVQLHKEGVSGREMSRRLGWSNATIMKVVTGEKRRIAAKARRRVRSLTPKGAAVG